MRKFSTLKTANGRIALYIVLTTYIKTKLVFALDSELQLVAQLLRECNKPSSEWTNGKWKIKNETGFRFLDIPDQEPQLN